jgi:hypothetical protein
MEATIFSEIYNWLQGVVSQTMELFGNCSWQRYPIVSEACTASCPVSSRCFGLKRRGLDANRAHSRSTKDEESLAFTRTTRFLWLAKPVSSFINKSSYTHTRGVWSWRGTQFCSHSGRPALRLWAADVLSRLRFLLGVRCPSGQHLPQTPTLALQALTSIIHTSLSLGAVQNSCSQQGINK